MILTTLADYAKQKGITRARAYQLQSKLSTIELPVYAVKDLPSGGNVMYPLIKDGNQLTQTYVQQSMADMQAELNRLRAQLKRCSTYEVCRLADRIRAIEHQLE